MKTAITLFCLCAITAVASGIPFSAFQVFSHLIIFTTDQYRNGWGPLEAAYQGKRAPS